MVELGADGSDWVEDEDEATTVGEVHRRVGYGTKIVLVGEVLEEEAGGRYIQFGTVGEGRAYGVSLPERMLCREASEAEHEWYLRHLYGEEL